MSGAWLAHRLSRDIDLICHTPQDVRDGVTELPAAANGCNTSVVMVRDAGTFVRAPSDGCAVFVDGARRPIFKNREVCGQGLFRAIDWQRLGAQSLSVLTRTKREGERALLSPRERSTRTVLGTSRSTALRLDTMSAQRGQNEQISHGVDDLHPDSRYERLIRRLIPNRS